MPTIIKPTIGRRVWFWPNSPSPAMQIVQGSEPQPCDAGIAYVWGDHLVNLSVADHAGVIHSRTSVRLIQDGDETPAPGTGMYATWMPYQVGQAAKAEKGTASPA